MKTENKGKEKKQKKKKIGKEVTWPQPTEPEPSTSPTHQRIPIRLVVFNLETPSSSVEHWRALDPPLPLRRSR
jgi:hypothetical protein